MLDGEPNAPKLPIVVNLTRGQNVVQLQTGVPDNVRRSNLGSELRIGNIALRYRENERTFKITMPFASPDQLYYRKNGETLKISTDLRLFAQNRNQLDEQGLYSLLQFGALVPPLTIWKNVKQLVPGSEFKVDISTLNITESTIRTSSSTENPQDPTLPLADQAKILTELLDTTLIQACPTRDPIILFSGGVDSSILAVRAVSMGWKQTTLVNYRFGENDPESTFARKMAKQIGLDIVHVEHSDAGALEILNQAGATYSHPFGDPSSLPTYFLANFVARSYPTSRVVIDGTGADGAFGMFAKVAMYERLYKIPSLIRSSIAGLYPFLFDHNVASKLERYARIVRRSSQMPMLIAAVARNPLLNVAYETSKDIYSSLFGRLSGWIDSNIASPDNEARIPALDVALNCCRILAQKDKSIFDTSGHLILYPFLQDKFVEIAIQRARLWPGKEKPKNVLKYMLASYVPQSMVYREKSGFVAPYRSVYSDPAFVDAFDELLARDSIFESMLNPQRLINLRASLAAGTRLPDQTYWFVWTAVFANLWAKQVISNAEQ